MWSCSPKKQHGKVLLMPMKEESTWSRSSFSHLIGCMELFYIFMYKPENPPNACKIVPTASISSFTRLMRMAVLYAYMDVFHLAVVKGKGVRTPCCVARSNIRCSVSMAMMKSMGESGFP